MSKTAVKLIEIYQIYFSFDRGLLSLFAPGGACKYPTTCSEYTKDAIIQYGVVKGIWLGVNRVWRCR